MRWHHSLLLFNSTLAGRALGLIVSARDALRPRKEERRIVFVDARALRAEEAAP